MTWAHRTRVMQRLMQRSLARSEKDDAIRSDTLGPARWNFVCVHTQVFRKNCVNSSLKPEPVFACNGTGRGPESAAAKNKKGADRRPFVVRWMQRSLQILAKQLALRELERL